MSILSRLVGTAKDQTQDSPTIQTTGVEALDQEIARFDIAGAIGSTTLSAHDLYLLRAAGFAPKQIVFGNFVYSMGLGGVWRTVRRALKRGEIPDFTRMLNDARVLARNRLIEAAQAIGAEEVVGVHFTVNNFADFIEVSAVGTAVVRVADFAVVPAAVGA